jgi:ABC-2 type transport system permease protein
VVFLNRIGAIARKELFHIVRDPFTMMMALGMPVMMVMIFGTAFEFNQDHIPLAVHDGDRSAASRQVIAAFSSSGHFNPSWVESPQAAQQALDSGRAQTALVIPPGFARELRRRHGKGLQVLVDGSDNASAASVLSYLPQVQAQAINKLALVGAPLAANNFQTPTNSITLVPRFLFNAELSSRWFMVPGLGVLIMAVLSILLTSLTVAREWESGSMELLLSTPVRPLEIIIGKVLPYLFLGLIGVALVYLSARLVFGVPFRGSHLLYALGCGIFIATCMAQGVLISAAARNQQLAMQAAIMSGLLPTIYLSGFMFPIEHMPTFFRYLTLLLAPRWFMHISRSLYLKGAEFIELALHFLALTSICCCIIALAAVKFKKDMEP